MSPVQHLREFIRERLTAAAEAIFTEVEKTLELYEEELDAQHRRLLEVCWKEQSGDVSEQPDVPVDLQHFNQEETSCPDQAKPEPLPSDEPELPELPQIKWERKDPEALPEPSIELPSYNSLLTLSSVQPAENNPFSAFNVHHTALNDTRTTINTYGGPEQAELSAGSEIYRTECQGKSDPRQHSRRQTGNRLFRCQTCGKCFNWRSNLTVHMKIHSGEKPFACATCGKRFCQSNQLVVHVRSHTGEKPFPCQRCHKNFSRRHNLIHHMKIHNNTT